jgi:hypothetical protein
MPMDRSLYPPDWEAIALAIKDSADWTCQECGKPCRKPGETRGELVERLYILDVQWVFDHLCDEVGGEYVVRWQRFTLTVAHLNHQPDDCSPENLRALCAPCHCRYDLAAMAQKRALRLERQGQLTLPL